jgi:hypothetical protein
VTLYMSWGIATGHTVGYKAFYTHLAEKFRGNRTVPLDDSGSAETWAEIIDDYAATNFDKLAEMPIEEYVDGSFKDGFVPHRLSATGSRRSTG